MQKCKWVRVDGTPCRMPALKGGTGSCGNHDPNGKYALQHPDRRAYLLERIREGSDVGPLRSTNAER